MATHKSYGTEERRLYQREYRAAGRDKTTRAGRNKSAEFVGFDGEGGDTDDGYHAYFLLSSGQSSIVPYRGNVRLTTSQCLEYICKLNPEAIHVVFFGDYDVTKILEDLPFDKLNRLMNRSLRTRKDGGGTFPVDYGLFELDYLPRKEFKVRKKGGKWVAISDIGPFFQCRFVEALEKWGVGTEEERRIIAVGKELRGSFLYSQIENIAHYNFTEIKLMQELMDKFRAACIDVDIIPAKWQGPGQLAEALFAKYHVPKSKEVPLLNDAAYVDLMDFARSSFYGGRPEIGVVGPCDGVVEQWDLNSAYPFAMLYVPCLMHGQWDKVTHNSPYPPVAHSLADEPESYAIHFGSFEAFNNSEVEKPAQYYGLPTRNKQGSICYPEAGRGWYWSFEIEASIHQVFHIEESWTYTRTCECRPLDFVDDVYQERLRMGKDGAGMILKLALNSLYGKTVQSIGTPKYGNPIWGSFITAFCRTMIQRFIHSSPACPAWCGSDVLMIATDSVCTTTRRTDMRSSKALGCWSVETHDSGMFLVQPGLYFGTSGKPSKTRGVPRSVIEEREQDFRDAFTRMSASRRLEDGDIRVEQTMFVGIKYALHRKNMKLLGQWISFTDLETGQTGKRISFDWHTKRLPFPVLEPHGSMQSYLLTFPKPGSMEECTVPYSKDIGGIQALIKMRGLFDGQPDWAQDITASYADDR